MQNGAPLANSLFTQTVVAYLKKQYAE